MGRILLGMVVVTLGLACPAGANPVVSNQPQPPSVEQSRWVTYTPRQRAIAVAVAQLADAYYAQTATPLPVTPKTIAMVIQHIEAEPTDAAFIHDRMYAHSLAQANIHQIDPVLDQAHQQIQTP